MAPAGTSRCGLCFGTDTCIHLSALACCTLIGFPMLPDRCNHITRNSERMTIPRRPSPGKKKERKNLGCYQGAGRLESSKGIRDTSELILDAIDASVV